MRLLILLGAILIASGAAHAVPASVLTTEWWIGIVEITAGAFMLDWGIDMVVDRCRS